MLILPSTDCTAVLRAWLSVLGLKVLAEGMETTAQRDCLFENGCQACQGCQGCLCAWPLEAEALARMLRASSQSP